MTARFLHTILVSAACWLCCSSTSWGQSVQITASSLTAGGSNCVIISVAHSGTIATVVELNGVVLVKRRITQISGTQVEVCFDLPAGARGGDLTVTATCGGHSGWNTWVVP